MECKDGFVDSLQQLGRTVPGRRYARLEIVLRCGYLTVKLDEYLTWLLKWDINVVCVSIRVLSFDGSRP